MRGRLTLAFMWSVSAGPYIYIFAHTSVVHIYIHTYICTYVYAWASQVAQLVKNPPASVGDARDVGSILGSGRSPGGGNGNPLQYSCLENPMGRGAWRATVHRVAKIQIRLKQLSTHACLENK